MVLKTCPICQARTPVACKRCRNCNYQFQKKPKIVPRPMTACRKPGPRCESFAPFWGNTIVTVAPTGFEMYDNVQEIQVSPVTQWYGPPSAKKIRAGQDYDLMTAVEDAAKFVEVKVERMDNIALTLQHINDRIVNQDRLWYHLRQSDEPDVAEDSSTDASVSFADSGEGQEEDVFVQTVRNLAPLESKDQPVQVSVIVDPKKLNSTPRGDSECVASRLPAVAQLMPTIPGQQQMYATFTPGMGMKFFVLPQGWNCYQVCNATPPVITPTPPNPPATMGGSIGSASPRDSLSVDTRSSGTTSSSDMESEAEAECAKMGSTPTAQAHHAERWPAVPIVQIDNVE